MNERWLCGLGHRCLSSPRPTVPVTRPSSWRSIAAVAPQIVSPTMSKKKIDRVSPKISQRSSWKVSVVHQLGERNVQHRLDLGRRSRSDSGRPGSTATNGTIHDLLVKVER